MKPTPPDTLTVVMLDTASAYISLCNLGEAEAFRRRTVHIALTPEQIAQITPRELGVERGEPLYETVERCWLEDRRPA